MTCQEPACPWPAARDGYCEPHWKLHYGTRDDLLMGPVNPPDEPKWTPGLTDIVKPNRKRQDSGRKGAEAMLRAKGLR